MSEFLSGCIKQTEAYNDIVESRETNMKEELIKLFEKYDDINMSSASARQMLASEVLELVQASIDTSFTEDYDIPKQQELSF